MILFLTEDSSSSMKQIEELRKINYQLVHSSSPGKALELIKREERIKLILVDIDSIPNSSSFISEASHYRDLSILYTTLQGEEYREIIQNHNAVMLIINSETGDILMANSSACKFYGWSKEEITQMTIHQINTLSREEVRERMRSARNQKNNVFSFKHRLAHGEIRDVQVFSGPISFEGRVCLFSIIHDVTDREKAYKKIEHQAYYDSLTGLPNREKFSETLKKLVASSKGASSDFALLHIDLDHFKDINDNFGHDIGDLLLIKAADRLQRVSDINSTIYRLGGDEFTVILKNCRDRMEITSLCNKILKSLESSFRINGNELFISASIGVATYPKDGSSSAELFKNSDLAMYRAKSEGKNRYSFFDGDLRRIFKRKIWIERELRRALKGDKLSLHFQPRVDIDQNKIIASEASIHWKTTEGESIDSTEFLPVAESSGLILEVDKWLLLTVFKQAREWETRGIREHIISVRISNLHFRHNRILKTLSDLALITPILPGRIEIEITEELFTGNTEDLIPLLRELRAMGVEISIDGFGTGFHSLSFIKDLPIHRVKVDKRFITNLSTDPCDATIVKTIITMGELLDLKVTAEGIHTEEQLETLCKLGCYEAQGNYFAPPLSPLEYENFYLSWPSSQIKERIDSIN